MHRAVMSVVALALIAALAGAAWSGDSGKKAESKKVTVFKQWSDWYPYPQDKVKLPWFEAKQDAGVIDNAKTFESIWKGWSTEAEGTTPKVDFQKYLILFLGRNVLQRTQMKALVLDADGTLSYKVESIPFAFEARPSNNHISMHMVVIPRAGIKAVDTGNGVFDVPPLPAPNPEPKKTSVESPTALLYADEAEEKAIQFIRGLGGKVDSAEVNGPITVVVLKGTKASDADLKQLGVLKAMRVLSLQGTPVTDAGLKELTGLKELQELDLRASKVTGTGLKALAGLKALRWLDLAETKVTLTHLKELATFEALEELNLSNTMLGGAGLKELADLKGLRWLSLSGTKVGDADLKAIAGLEDLRTLSLFGTLVTDAGLKQLAPLKRLRLVDVGESKVTGDGIAWLTKNLPDCDVLR